MVLVTLIYEVTNKFPKDEVYGLTSQIRRCSISIPSNIAEGYGRNSDVELKRFLSISLGSLFELQTQIEIAYNIRYLDQISFQNLYNNTRELEIMLASFINKIKHNG